MYVFSFIAIGVILCILQALMLLKVKNKVIQYLPIIVAGAGSLFSLAVGLLGTGSASVIAENQSFAVFIGVPFAAGLAGCVIGLVLVRLKKSQ